MGKYREFRLFRTLRAILEWIAGSPWRYFTLIFLLSITVRIYQLNQLTSVYPGILAPTGEREKEAIAISLYKTGEFANPYILPTGPTAHLPPIPPLIESLIYQLFGLTAKAGYVSAVLSLAAASVLYGMMPWFSGWLGMGRVAGLIGGLIGAFGGLEKTIWDKLPGHGEYLAGLLLGLVMVAFLRRWKGQASGWVGSLLFGIAVGIAFHVQPALLPVIVGFIMFEIWWVKGSRKWLPLGALTLGILTALIPWGWRNYQTFQAIFFIRDNLGLELRMGNNAGALATFGEMDAIRTKYLHPRADFSEARLVIEMGEVAYMHQAQDEALAWIHANLSRFLSLTVERFANLWIGPPYWLLYFEDVVKLTVLAIIGLCLAIPRIKIPERAAILIPLVTFPLIYYVVAYEPRYRIPINWILYLLAGVVVWMVIGGLVGRDMVKAELQVDSK